ncbi:MAG: ribonuclease P protein component [Bacteroidota bacterium]|nr:ribonuclease P protein component [Bacteroidota bacterium]MDP3147020.1 ribonuclease P protein component [Bacteroidota bacterium]
MEKNFNKQERLCSKKQIDLLFLKGNNAISFPLKLIYLETDVGYVNPCQAMFVVPKRAFKRAHDRNKLKRRMREAYRLNKASFYEVLSSNNKKIILSFLFVGKKSEDYSLIESAIINHLKRIELAISK